MGSSLKIIFDHFFTISVFVVVVFSFSSKISNLFIFFFYFFYFTRTMKIIKGRRYWVLTEEPTRLTTMDDNNTLTVFEGYYTRSLFPLTAFRNGVAGIRPVFISLNEIMTLVLEFLLACIERDSLCYNIFVSSQYLSGRHKPISNSKLTDLSASSESPHSREMTDPQPRLNSEYLELASVSSQCRIVLCRIAALSKDST